MNTDNSTKTDMKQPSDDNKQQISFVAMLFFALCLAVTAILLIAAAVMWLADILGSIALSCLIFGGVAAVIALTIYLCSVRRSTKILREYLDTVYETSRIARSSYEQMKSWATLLFK